MIFQVRNPKSEGRTPSGEAKAEGRNPNGSPGAHFADHALRITHHGSRHPSRANRHSQNGIALVITLILLAVITFMAITFLVLSTRDRGSVTTATDQANARFANEAALERVKSDIITLIQATTNSFNYDLFVSQAYKRFAGYDPSAAPNPNGVNITNVNYDYRTDGQPFTFDDRMKNLLNLYIDPLPPVYVFNRATKSNDFRHFINLNRNVDSLGNPLFDPTGTLVLSNWNGTALVPMTNPTNQSAYLTANLVGDPQWIGILERPGFPHSPSNRFFPRIAYIALPASKTLDVNYIYGNSRKVNGSRNLTPIGCAVADPFQGRDFMRDQGIGSWEINLAALLRDLNTNLWSYNYQSYHDTTYDGQSAFFNQGTAFDDATMFLYYRNVDYPSAQKTVPNYFDSNPATGNGTRARFAFLGDHLDDYAVGPPMYGTTLWATPPLASGDFDPVNLHWFGSDNTNHFFSTQEFFDSQKVGTHFPQVIRLIKPPGISTTDSYNRYTYYRLLAGLGSDSAAEPPSKMNINYDNLTRGRSATNFFNWQPLEFFTNAAGRLFTDTFGNNPNLNTTHIPITGTNLYTASVHRLLQLAANLYDATVTTNSEALPSVFRPLFRREPGGQIIIAGYSEVTNNGSALADNLWSSLPQGMYELDNPTNTVVIPNVGDPPPADEPLVSGIPLIVGAKKGWPSFNQFGMQTVVQVTRKMQFLRSKSADASTSPLIQTNIMYLFSITNLMGLNAWNSYTNRTTRDLILLARVEVTATVTNDTGKVLLARRVARGTNMPVLAGSWVGFSDFNRAAPSFKFALDPATASFSFITNVQYSGIKEQFILADPFPDRPSYFPVPRLWLTLSTHVRFALVDTQTKRLVDYVNLDSFGSTPETRWNLTELLMTGGRCGGPSDARVPDGAIGSLFCTNRGVGVAFNDETVPTYGMLNQIDVSFFGADRNSGGIVGASWNSFQQTPQGYDQYGAVNFFRTNLSHTAAIPGTDARNLYMTNEFYAPYSPTRSISFYTAWSINDPIVHYTVDDLKDLGAVTNLEFESMSQSPIPDMVARQVSKRYDPWNGSPRLIGEPDEQKYDLTRKDPGMFRSDAWDFPTNKLPNIGWIGRVHRGTPWQTIYFKQPAANPGLWRLHTGNGRLLVNKGQLPYSLVASNAIYEDAALTRPTNDWRVAEIFTTVLDDNASRGQMSVNQSGLAAWSALLSGVLVLTNYQTDDYFADLVANSGSQPLPPPPTTSLVIDPAGVFDYRGLYDTTIPIPPLVQLVSAINRTRGNTNLFSKQAFSHLGDILAVPELTVASPFLNRSSDYQLRYGLNDEVYERIPQQIFGLLKIDTTPRYVVYAWGQALKPADRSVIMSGPYSGLCTNYQISAEVETRTTFRIEGAPDNPRVIVENYNIVPPE